MGQIIERHVGAKSTADFINKLKIVEEELDETMFFLELFAEFNVNAKQEIVDNWKEANELLSIIVTSLVTSKRNAQIRKS